MTTQIEAMKMMVEALEGCINDPKMRHTDTVHYATHDALAAGRAAIEAAEKVEPVAWRYKPKDGSGWDWQYVKLEPIDTINYTSEPLYLHPQCEHQFVTTFGGDWCIKCNAPAPSNEHPKPSAEIEELERQLAECERERDELVEVLKQFAECDLNDGNCASLEVATRRIRSLAQAALAKVGAYKDTK